MITVSEPGEMAALGQPISSSSLELMMIAGELLHCLLLLLTTIVEELQLELPLVACSSWKMTQMG